MTPPGETEVDLFFIGRLAVLAEAYHENVGRIKNFARGKLQQKLEAVAIDNCEIGEHARDLRRQHPVNPLTWRIAKKLARRIGGASFATLYCQP